MVDTIPLINYKRLSLLAIIKGKGENHEFDRNEKIAVLIFAACISIILVILDISYIEIISLQYNGL